MATQPTEAIEIFYSYSHKDEELRDQLENHLALLRREGVIKNWHDHLITAGREWEGEIDDHLNSADIILLLASPDFLASDYCYDVEVKRAMERHEAGEARVIPIILRTCGWATTPFSKIQALPKGGKPVKKWDDPDDAFEDIAKGIRKAAAEITLSRQHASPPEPETPRPTPSLHIPNILRVEFVPRKDQNGDIVARLREELAPHKRRLVALWGAGGVGKTALAIETARGLAETFEHRVAWVSADGLIDFNLSTLLDAIATQFGQDDLRKLALEPKKEQVRAVVATTPALIVLDNFETIEPQEAQQCAEWLAQPALCSALITTRDKVENDAARNIPITPMQPEEAHKLLQQLIAQAHEPRAFTQLDHDDLIRTAEANPLVLQWIVGQIDLAQDPQEVLDDLRHGEGKAAKRVFDRSFKLKQLDNGGRAVLLALSLFAPSATRKALAAVSGLDKDKDRKRFKDAVRNLSALWLIRTAEDSPRLAVEGLTREFTKAHLSADPRDKTFRRRFTARFLKYAEANSDTTPEHLNAMEEEKDNILSAIDVAFEINDGNWLIRIGVAVGGFLRLRGYWDESIRRGEQALEVARKLSDEDWIKLLTHNLALTHQSRGNLSKARELYDESLNIERKFHNQHGIAVTLHTLGTLAHDQGELEEAKRLYDESMEISKRLGDQRGIAMTLHTLGTLAQDQGELEEAKRLYDESMEIEKKLGNQSGIASTLHTLGTLAHDQGELEEAKRLYDESMEIEKKFGNQSGIATTLHTLGTLAHDQGELEEAKRLYDESMEISMRLGDQGGIATMLHTLGTLAQEQGELEEAKRLYDESMEINKRLGNQGGIASTLHTLGTLAQEQGELEEAKRLYDESMEIEKKLGNQSGISVSLRTWGVLAQEQGELEEARRLYNESMEISKRLGNQSGIASTLGQLGLLAAQEGDKAEATRLLREALGIFERLKSPYAEIMRENLRQLEDESS